MVPINQISRKISKITKMSDIRSNINIFANTPRSCCTSRNFFDVTGTYGKRTGEQDPVLSQADALTNN